MKKAHRKAQAIGTSGRRHFQLVLVALLSCTLLSCVSPYLRPGTKFAALFQDGRGFTLVNLHPDEVRSKLYAVNYQQPGLIPVCSRVEFLTWEGNRMRFRVESTGRVYAYDYHKAAVVPFEDHLQKYFGSQCDSSRVERLSATDRQGVRTGRVSIGMTKEATILAIGYPPPHRTPTLDASEWRYWKNRFNTILVVFGADDRVSAIRE